MIYITAALINQLTSAEELAMIIMEMFSIGMFTYLKEPGRIHKISNCLSLLRKIDLVTFDVRCSFCLLDCSCKQVCFLVCPHWTRDFVSTDGAADGVESKLDSIEYGDVDSDESLECSCYVRQSPKNAKRSYSSSLTNLQCRSDSPTGSPAKKGRPLLGRPPD